MADLKIAWSTNKANTTIINPVANLSIDGAVQATPPSGELLFTGDETIQRFVIADCGTALAGDDLKCDVVLPIEVV